MKEELINKAYEIAKERYAAVGVDTRKSNGNHAEFPSVTALLASR